MKVWLDDVRPMPSGWDVHIRTAIEASQLVLQGQVTDISLDHDLGEKDLTGYFVAKMIEDLAYHGTIPKINWTIHSANPVGRANMEMALKNADKFWDSQWINGEAKTSERIQDEPWYADWIAVLEIHCFNDGGFFEEMPDGLNLAVGECNKYFKEYPGPEGWKQPTVNQISRWLLRAWLTPQQIKTIREIKNALEIRE